MKISEVTEESRANLSVVCFAMRCMKAPRVVQQLLPRDLSSGVEPEL